MIRPTESPVQCVRERDGPLRAPVGEAVSALPQLPLCALLIDSPLVAQQGIRFEYERIRNFSVCY